MSPRYIIMKEPRKNRMMQEAVADAQTNSAGEEQPEPFISEWTGSQIGQSSDAQEEFISHSETPSME